MRSFPGLALSIPVHGRFDPWRKHAVLLQGLKVVVISALYLLRLIKFVLASTMIDACCKCSSSCTCSDSTQQQRLGFADIAWPSSKPIFFLGKLDFDDLIHNHQQQHQRVARLLLFSGLTLQATITCDTEKNDMRMSLACNFHQIQALSCERAFP